MRLPKRTPSGREKDEAEIELLAKLREKLHSENVSTARLAAFNLSWKQEDGLDILKETLFAKCSRTAKKAAAYGLRSMKGRMKKLAVEVLNEGVKHRDRTTSAACTKALFLLAGGVPEKPPQRRRPRPNNKSRIREIPRRGPRQNRPRYRGSSSNR